jgi:hypothetical protein
MEEEKPIARFARLCMRLDCERAREIECCGTCCQPRVVALLEPQIGRVTPTGD